MKSQLMSNHPDSIRFCILNIFQFTFDGINIDLMEQHKRPRVTKNIRRKQSALES